MNRVLIGVAVVLGLSLFVLSQALFTVDPTEQALVLRFGQPVGDVIDASGLHFKAPFIDHVVYIDRRILSLDDDRQEVLVAENQRLQVDTFVRYRIADPLLYFQSVGTVPRAESQLSGLLNSALRRVLSEASILDIVRDKREPLMAAIRAQTKESATRFGLEVIDVRLKRTDLPADNSDAVFGRMRAQWQQSAELFRAQGRQQAQKIRADAERDATVIRATAKQKAEQLRAEGDGERTRIFAETYGADPEFFAFWRSMQAYETSLTNGRAVMGPTSDFFRYFQSPNPAAAAKPQTPEAEAKPETQDAK